MGKLGGQAEVPNVAGTWKDLTDLVNLMGFEPDQPGPQHRPGDHRAAEGDLTQKVTVDVQGEIAELKETVNTMVDHRRSRPRSRAWRARWGPRASSAARPR